jgi:hypothetical protein
MAPDNDDIPYYKINRLLWRWKWQDGARVVREVSLSMDKAPPPLPKPPKAPVAAQAPEPKPPPAPALIRLLDGLESVGNAVSRFNVWLDTPPAPKPPSAPKLVKKVETVPPFDLQEIPKAMRKEHLPKSAAVMEGWLARRLNYSLTTEDEKNEINQDGKPYPPDMYDMTTITLDWVLGFARAKEKFDLLINERIRLPVAREALIRKRSLRYKDQYEGAYKYRILPIENSDLAKNDPIALHRDYQFQRATVDGTLGDKIALLLKTNLLNNGAPDDLTGALGSFNFYAAVAKATISWDAKTGRSKAVVTGIYVYVKDGYTFTDEAGARSQYLGHWSHDRVIVVLYDAAAEKISRLPYDKDVPAVGYTFDAPVAVGDIATKGNVHYPVYNSSFREWAIKHQLELPL